jgi:carboxylesterase
MEDKMKGVIIPQAEPFYFPGGKTGCLLIHGLTGSPTDMRPFGEYLAGQGYSVLGVRLMGHATQPEDLIRARWRDWLAGVEDGWHLLKNGVEQVFVIGLSLGGVLSFLFASRFPVSGVVAMSTPFELPKDPRLRFIKIISRFKPFLPKENVDDRDPVAYKSHVSYPAFPVRAIAELQELLLEMQGSLSKISVPVLLMHSRGDRMIPSDHPTSIFDRLGTEEKRLIWVTDRGHNIALEPNRAEVFDVAAQFIQEVSKANS